MAFVHHAVADSAHERGHNRLGHDSLRQINTRGLQPEAQTAAD